LGIKNTLINFIKSQTVLAVTAWFIKSTEQKATLKIARFILSILKFSIPNQRGLERATVMRH